MTCEECEALCVLLKQHLAEVSVTKTNFSLICNRAGDTESLKTLTDSGSSLGSLLAALLDCDSAAYCVSPLSVLEADRLDLLYKCIDVKTLFLADICTFFY